MPPVGQSKATRVALVVTAALVVFGLWLLLSQSGGGGVSFFYAVPIGLAVWWFGLPAGVLTALACIALYAVGAAIEPVTDFPVALSVRLLAFVGIVLIVAVLRERLDALEHSAEELEDIRAALAPPSLPELDHVEAGAAFAPSDHGVSGDFYLLTNGPDGSTIAIIGDVVGHGPPAARLATFVRARLAAFAANTSDPAQILELANAALIERPRHAAAKELVSAVCMRFEPATSVLCWAVAGHPRPLRLPDLGELRHDGDTLLLGIDARLRLSSTSVALRSGEGVLAYTDGATDVRRERDLLGREGFVRLLAPLAHLPARQLASDAHQAVLGWTDGPLPDDLCLLVLRPRAT